MIRYYATLCDRNYLPKCLALYESLVRHSSATVDLAVLAMDEETRATFARLDLPSAVAHELWHVEEVMGLSGIRRSRTWQEYCWSLASIFLEYLMQSGMKEMTYLDSDTYCFSDLEPVFAEIGDRPIAITPHRLIPSKRHLETNGIFNVGFVHFKNAGMSCLSWWAQRVRERCSASIGCGDQKYLDSFPDLFGRDCHIIQNIGCNAAPWNIGNWTVTEGPCVNGVPVSLYHAHEFAEREDGSYRLTNYELRDEDIEFIYKPYIAAYDAAKSSIETIHLQPR